MDNGNVSLFGYTYNSIDGIDSLEVRLGVEVDNSNLNKGVRIGTRIINTIGGSTTNVFQGITISQYGALTFPDNTVQSTAWTGFSVAADDSTQRLINAGEVVKFIGAGGITTASDAEGNITINYVQGDIRSEGNINIDINLSDSTLRRWRFGEDGLLTFPDGTNQSTAWTGSTTVSSLVNGANTLGLGSTGTLTLPEGSTIDESLEIVTVTLDQFTDGGFPGTRVFTKTSDTLYELSPGGPYMTLISGIWRLKVGPSTYYDSTDLITWGTIAGGLPTPVGTLTTVVTTNLTVGGDVWGFDGNGALTFPDATTQTTAYTGIPGPYADDEAAALAGVALGSPYHKTGTGGQVFVRLTSPT